MGKKKLSDPVARHIAKMIGKDPEYVVDIWTVPRHSWEIRAYSVQAGECGSIEVFDEDLHDGVTTPEELTDLGHLFLSPREAAQFIFDNLELGTRVVD